MNYFKLRFATSRDEGLARDGKRKRTTESVAALTRQRGMAVAPAPPDRPAWEQIQNHNWDREALQLWWAGYTCREIGAQLQPTKAPKTIRNQLCLLRRIYSTDLVPEHPQRWKHIRERGTTRD